MKRIMQTFGLRYQKYWKFGRIHLPISSNVIVNKK